MAEEDVLSKIREARQRREAMIRSVHFLVKATTSPLGRGPLEVEQEWYVERNKLLCIESSAKPGEPKLVVNWDSTDGNWNYHCNYWADDPSKVQAITCFPANPLELRYRCPLLTATGEVLPCLQETLDTLLRSEGCEVLADDKHVANCVRVRMGPVNSQSGKPHWVNVWFDPKADYLPRRYLIASEKMTGEVLSRQSGHLGLLEEGEIFELSSVGTFQDWRDPATNTSIKFPRLGSVLEYVILAVNEPLPASRLIPPMDQGVEVIMNPGTPQQTSRIVGGESDARAHFARRMTASAVVEGAASLKLAQEAPLAVAEPRLFLSRWASWLGITVAVLSVFGIVWRLRVR